MARQTLMEKLEQLENQLWAIRMTDHWTREDYRLYDRVKAEIASTEETLAAMA